ncbi:MAG: hypothetical protein ACREIA_01835 [Opitutaceae bacterium]
MNAAQHRKYCICAAQAAKAMRKLGHEGSDSDLRRFCRVQAIGKDKDSRALNNHEFDRVLMVFAGYHSMADLGEQMRLIEQPLRRLMFAAAPLLDELHIAEEGREAYLAAIYRRVQARRPERDEQLYELASIPDEDVPLVLGALNHTVEHKLGIAHQHSRTGRGRARYAHMSRAKTADVPHAEEIAPADRAEDIADEPDEASMQEPWF